MVRGAPSARNDQKGVWCEIRSTSIQTAAKWRNHIRTANLAQQDQVSRSNQNPLQQGGFRYTPGDGDLCSGGYPRHVHGTNASWKTCSVPWDSGRAWQLLGTICRILGRPGGHAAAEAPIQCGRTRTRPWTDGLNRGQWQDGDQRLHQDTAQLTCTDGRAPGEVRRTWPGLAVGCL